MAEALLLHTAPPYQSGLALAEPEYCHIVGISFGGETLSRHDRDRYSQTGEESLALPDTDQDFGTRITGFFNANLAKGPDPDGDYLPEDMYNCHLFAAFINNTVEKPKSLEAADRAKLAALGIVTTGETAPNVLPFGVQAVVSGHGKDGNPRPFHSVIGLGEIGLNARILEVDRVQGDLGVRSLAAVLGYYKSRYNATGLYSLTQRYKESKLATNATA